jgi:thiol:disulfide interchange protein
MPLSLSERRRIQQQHDKTAQVIGSDYPAFLPREIKDASEAMSTLLKEHGTDVFIHFTKQWCIARYVMNRITIDDIRDLGQALDRLADEIEREEI